MDWKIEHLQDGEKHILDSDSYHSTNTSSLWDLLGRIHCDGTRIQHPTQKHEKGVNIFDSPKSSFLPATTTDSHQTTASTGSN